MINENHIQPQKKTLTKYINRVLRVLVFRDLTIHTSHICSIRFTCIQYSCSKMSSRCALKKNPKNFSI